MDKRAEAREMSLAALRTPPPAFMLNEPIDYMFADHFRQRTLCTILDQIADAAEPDHEAISASIEFLKTEFGPHVQDEEQDLFPVLQQRATEEDEIGPILDQLGEEHAADKVDAASIIEQLAHLKSRKVTKIGSKLAQLLKRFAANERQHLIVENAIVLPLARARLTTEDCKLLGQRMAARRGIKVPARKPS